MFHGGTFTHAFISFVQRPHNVNTNFLSTKGNKIRNLECDVLDQQTKKSPCIPWSIERSERVEEKKRNYCFSSFSQKRARNMIFHQKKSYFAHPLHRDLRGGKFFPTNYFRGVASRPALSSSYRGSGWA